MTDAGPAPDGAGISIEQIRLDLTRSAKPRVRRADTDRREPRRELRVTRVPVKAATAGEPGLLDDVIDFVASPGAEESHDDHAQPGRVSQIQLAERGLVSSEEPTDQCGVREIGEEAAAGHISRWADRPKGLR